MMTSAASWILSGVFSVVVVFLSYLFYDFRRRLNAYEKEKRRVEELSSSPYSSSSTSSSSANRRLPGRLLDFQEVFYEMRQRHADLLDVNAAFFDSVDEPIGEKLLLKALSRVAAKHPMLRVVIRGEGREEDGEEEEEEEQGEGKKERYLRFEQRETVIIDLERVDTFDWQSVVDAEFLHGFPRGAYPWRVKMLKSRLKPVNNDNSALWDKTRSF